MGKMAKCINCRPFLQRRKTPLKRLRARDVLTPGSSFRNVIKIDFPTSGSVHLGLYFEWRLVCFCFLMIAKTLDCPCSILKTNGICSDLMSFLPSCTRTCESESQRDCSGPDDNGSPMNAVNHYYLYVLCQFKKFNNSRPKE